MPRAPTNSCPAAEKFCVFGNACIRSCLVFLLHKCCYKHSLKGFAIEPGHHLNRKDYLEDRIEVYAGFRLSGCQPDTHRNLRCLRSESKAACCAIHDRDMPT